MPDYQLYATEKIQMDIESALKAFGLFYDRRKNFYKNQGKPIGKIISPLYLAQAVMSVALQRPNDARASPSRVLAAERAKIFAKKNPLAVYTTCARLMQQVDEFLRTAAKPIDKTTRSNVRFYMVMHVACGLVKNTMPTVRQIEKMKLPADGALMQESYKRVQTEYMKLGGTDQAAKGNELVASIKARIAEVSW